MNNPATGVPSVVWPRNYMVGRSENRSSQARGAGCGQGQGQETALAPGAEPLTNDDPTLTLLPYSAGGAGKAPWLSDPAGQVSWSGCWPARQRHFPSLPGSVACTAAADMLSRRHHSVSPDQPTDGERRSPPLAVRVDWRDDGHQLADHDSVTMLRFEVEDLNQVIKAAAAASPTYVPLLEACGLSPADRIMPLSCFAITQTWSPSRLAEGTNYHQYRQVAAQVLTDAGYLLIPTAVFDDNAPDPRNEMHYDLIVTAGANLNLGELAGTPAARKAARERLAPAFRAVLVLLGDPVTLPAAES